MYWNNVYFVSDSGTRYNYRCCTVVPRVPLLDRFSRVEWKAKLYFVWQAAQCVTVRTRNDHTYLLVINHGASGGRHDWSACCLYLLLCLLWGVVVVVVVVVVCLCRPGKSG